MVALSKHHNPEGSWCLEVRHAPQPGSPLLASEHFPDSFGNPTPANVIILNPAPVGCSGRARSQMMLHTPRRGARCAEGSSFSPEDAAAPSNVGYSSEHPCSHLSICPCPPSTLWSPTHIERHVSFSRREMKTVVVSTVGPSLFLRPQFARHWFVLPKKPINANNGNLGVLQLFLVSGWWRGRQEVTEWEDWAGLTSNRW